MDTPDWTNPTWICYQLSQKMNLSTLLRCLVGVGVGKKLISCNTNLTSESRPRSIQIKPTSRLSLTFSGVDLQNGGRGGGNSERCFGKTIWNREHFGLYYELCTKATVKQSCLSLRPVPDILRCHRSWCWREGRITGASGLRLIRTIWLDIQLALTYYWPQLSVQVYVTIT